ncbi:hypothetical protein C8Q75DRAFT_811857 [Abortiporus biennis]|nr:hypothetical protein C8Q75DRAFT_811857 [Abortiporus biennis]
MNTVDFNNIPAHARNLTRPDISQITPDDQALFVVIGGEENGIYNFEGLPPIPSGKTAPIFPVAIMAPQRFRRTFENVHNILQATIQHLPPDCTAKEAFNVIDTNHAVFDLFSGITKFYPITISKEGKPCIFISYPDAWHHVVRHRHSSFVVTGTLAEAMAFLFMRPETASKCRDKLTVWRLQRTMIRDESPPPPSPRASASIPYIPHPLVATPPPRVFTRMLPVTRDTNANNTRNVLHPQPTYAPPTTTQTRGSISSFPTAARYFNLVRSSAVTSPTLSSVAYTSTVNSSGQASASTLPLLGRSSRSLTASVAAYGVEIMSLQSYGLSLASLPHQVGIRTNIYGHLCNGDGNRQYSLASEPVVTGYIEVPNLGRKMNLLVDSFGFNHGIVCALGRAKEAANDPDEFADMMYGHGNFSLTELSLFYSWIRMSDDHPRRRRPNIYLD